MHSKRIYLDNAATSWPKPPSVYEAVEAYQRDNGAAAGRGSYSSTQFVSRTLSTTRRRLATLLGTVDPNHILFTFNGTDSLNQAIFGLLRPGDHVVTTDAEHNSVLRPLRYLEQHGGIQVTRVPCDGAGRIAPDDVKKALRSDTRLVAFVHVSNVTGVIQPVEEIVAVTRDLAPFVLIDVAQSAGHLPIQTERWQVDCVAMSGHKGLLGLLGTGVLGISERAAAAMRPLRFGGTGTMSERDTQPDTLPDRFESGNHNVIGLVGLDRGTAYVEQRGFDALRQHEMLLTNALLSGLSEIRGIEIFGPRDASQQVGLVSFRLHGFDPQELATLLDAEYRIEVRSGLHCAPRLHERLGTARRGGTVRASFGPFTTLDDVRALVTSLANIAAASG